MNVLVLNTNNRAGGATKACYRLHESYLKAGMHSRLLIREEPLAGLPYAYNIADYQYELHLKETKSIWQKLMYRFRKKMGTHPEVIYKKEVDYQEEIVAGRPPSLEVFTFYNSLYDITQHPLYKEADIIHMHWVTSHFVDYSFFVNAKKPIVWTLHDLNPFTGGCHYAGDCTKFQIDCHSCPQLEGTINNEYAHTELEKKLSAFQRFDKKKFAIASPSNWLMELSKSSKMFADVQHHLVPYGIDRTIYKLKDRAAAKKKLNLPTNKKIILFLAFRVYSIRKGYDLLVEAINSVNKDEYAVCTVGITNPDTTIFQGIEVHQLGYTEDEVYLSEIYNAADMFVIPSLADNLPNTVLESIMCGTPVIAFPVGGIPDMVQHGVNGLLCRDITAAALAESIIEFKNYEQRFIPEKISHDACEKYNEQVQIASYTKIYNQLLNA
ncbi:MAG: glycosyltransferase [Bacteroidota bacterium]